MTNTTRALIIASLPLFFAVGCGGDGGMASDEDSGTDGATDSDGSGETTADPTASSGNPTSSDPTGDPDSGETGSDSSADGSTGEAIDDEPPTVVSTSPADGEPGVLADAAIVVTFSEPMDKASVQAAYQSADIPSADVTFSWNAAADELTITPNDPLELAAGNDPDDVVAIDYEVVINTAARDLAGNELVENYTIGFSTARSIAQLLPPLGAWSGAIRADGVATFDYIAVGDSGQQDAENIQFKGFVSFEISGLPKDISSVTGAELWLYHTGTQGAPYQALGDLMAYDVEYFTMDGDAFSTTSLGEVGLVSNSDIQGWRVLEVGTFVAEDYEADRDATQFRLEFPTATNWNGETDAIFMHTIHQDPAGLVLFYLVP